MNRSLWGPGLLGVLAAGCLVAGGCSDTPDGDPMSFENPPAWTHEDLGLDSVTGAVFQDDSVIVDGKRDTESRLVVADTASGKARWTLSQGQVLPGGKDLRVLDDGHASPFAGSASTPVIVDNIDSWSVLVAYSEKGSDTADATNLGVAALSGRDGSLTWATPLADPDPDSLTAGAVPVAAGHDMVLAMDKSGPRAFALDATTGERLWEHRDVWPYAVTSQAVIGQMATSDEDAPWIGEEDSGGDVQAFGARHGEKLWKTSDSGDYFGPLLATSTAIVVSSSTEGRILDPSTGETIGKFDEGARDCAVDGAKPTRFACSVGNESAMATVAVKGGRATVEENSVTEEREEFTVTGMYDGRIFADTYNDNKTHKGKYILNDKAEIIAKEVPGYPVAISDKYALFLSDPVNSHNSSDAALHKVATS